MFALSYKPQIDGLRAVAVLTVVWWHADALPAWTRPFLPGPLAVALFFVLSGFLITGILLDARDRGEPLRRGRTLRAFYARRVLRIMPLYFLIVLLLAILRHPDVLQFPAYFAGYAVNFIDYRHPATPQIQGAKHLWSLCVEEQFYAVWPLLILYGPRSRLREIVLALVLLIPVSRCGIVFESRSLWEIARLAPPCVGALGMGALLALCPRGVFRSPWFGALSLAAFLLSWSTFLETFILTTAWAAFCAFLVIRAAEGGRGPWRILEARPLVFLGTISYGIYVYHWPIQWLLGARASIATTLPIAVAVSTVSWFGFERPVNGLKRLFPYSVGARAPREEDLIARQA